VPCHRKLIQDRAAMGLAESPGRAAGGVAPVIVVGLDGRSRASCPGAYRAQLA
jgi:hypothetical protein